MNNSILLNSGKLFDYDNISDNYIDIEDIAHGLSLTCRFGGQCKYFYSVAEHSYHVSLLVPPKYALIGLMHDASEAYLVDIPKPLKRLLDEYNDIEYALERHIAKQFGFQFPYPREIKEVDLRMLVTEQLALFKEHNFNHLFYEDKKIEPYPYTSFINGWYPDVAEEKFLQRFRFLGGFNKPLLEKKIED